MCYICAVFFCSMAIANSRILISFEEDVGDVRSSILKEFSIGTNLSEILSVFPRKFVVFEADLIENSGFVLPQRIAEQRNIKSPTGVSFLRVIVNKDWPKGLAPFVNSLFMYIGFDEKDQLVDVQVFHEVNSI